MFEIKAKSALKAGFLTFVLAAVLVGLKALAYVLSGSVAVLSSLTDSVIDLCVSGINFAAIWYSARPADEDHRYGHGKIEGLAALLQAVLMFTASVFLIIEAGRRFFDQTPIHDHEITIVIIVISILVSLLIVYFQKRAIHESGSLAVEADHTHYSSDIFMHIGVIAAVGIQYFGGPIWVDAVFALIVSVLLIAASRTIAGKGLDMVLDRELPEAKRAQILQIILAHQGVLGVHDLRTTRSGMKEMIAFDIEVDAALSLSDAHSIAKDLEAEILVVFPAAEIMIHVDPFGETEDSRHSVAGVHH